MPGRAAAEALMPPLPALARPVPPLQRLALRRDDAFPLRAEALGFTFHTPEGREYWVRDACYALTPEAIAAMEAAARELAPMLDAAASRIVARGDYAALGFTPRLAALVEASHRAAEPSLYGRFDFRL
ncbi:glutathionylspermidine synthase, partial [Pseudoroseomonas cervicalis]|nr:glutathionylspermidine synthase [Pseudoroseomonas cervicalis]